MDYFTFIFFVLLIVTLPFVCFVNRESFLQLDFKTLASSCGTRNNRLTLRARYLLVYAFIVSGDWLQGPFVYALYDYYGYDKQVAGQLFVAGYASSLTFGTAFGSMADYLGRKKMSLAYCICYIISCCTKHTNSFAWLVVGRLTGGISTSLLKSVFESWLLSEYHRENAYENNLPQILSLAATVNSISAILSGYIGHLLVHAVPAQKISFLPDWHFGGYTTPFDLAILVTFVAGSLIAFLWNENWGSNKQRKRSFADGVKLLIEDHGIFLVGLAQAAFEGSMYCFIFHWTPALLDKQQAAAPIPFGLIFASFMLCCMLGTQLFQLMIERMYSITSMLAFAFLAAAISLIATPLNLGPLLQYLGFLSYEACVGLYFPCIGILKGEIIPDSHRAKVYNIFRVPSNLVVLVVLLSDVSSAKAIQICIALNLFGAFCLLKVRNRSIVFRQPQCIVKAV